MQGKAESKRPTEQKSWGPCYKGYPELSREGHATGPPLLVVVLSSVGKKGRAFLQKDHD